MRFDHEIEEACAPIPGLVRAALVRLPDGVLLGGLGGEDEPMTRTAVACATGPTWPDEQGAPSGFVEYAFVGGAALVVIQRGRTRGELALVAVCTREPNLALVLQTTRHAVGRLEAELAIAEEG